MTLRHMKIFVSVCKENSITLAARKLYISQPAVSNAIKELEDYYNIPLFDRISKKLYLTEAGKHVYNYALHINALFEELEATIKNSDSMGTIKIGASITIGTHFIPDYIMRFSLKYPDITTFVTIDSSDIIEQMVLDNQLDFALIEGVIHSDNIISKEFIKDELIVICDLENPLLKKETVSINDLSTQAFLMRERNSGTRELAESILLLHNISLNPIWESSSSEAIIHGVSKGIGISILPQQIVQEAITRNQVKKLSVNGLEFNRQYHIIYHKNKYLTGAALAFIKLCCTS
ncbi:LysR family transcriptional regulator [[Clostridium] fimetarium]|uniref:DNA-binding transcriptional regulator, LysR family n=1 Tax=[Clostridium] fimetarium TaxID=99656 RepID=A0A1I0RMA0_9FIRM|nr:LysR family transcriptional regulator [[Clostridium] fimetarium]SEW42320.1 DNA-binding transcriptional regulator, LysR family [[Clostridium] fimetarium]